MGRIADDVVEESNARASHVVFLGITVRTGCEPFVLCRPKVPALAVEIDVGIDGLHGGLEVEHVLAGVQVHQVEAEAVHLVVGGEAHRRVDHQLLHHGVLGRRVGAAGGVVERSIGVVAVVVARHHLVQHRFAVLTAGGSVIVDHVHDHPQAVLVERRHHVAELEDARHAVGIGGIAAFRDAVVERVVAPVETIGQSRRADCCLLILRIARRCGHGRFGSLAHRLDHRGDVEGRQ